MMIGSLNLGSDTVKSKYSNYDCLRVIIHTSKRHCQGITAYVPPFFTAGEGTACSVNTGILNPGNYSNYLTRSMQMTNESQEMNYKIIWDKTFCMGAIMGNQVAAAYSLQGQAQHIDIQIPVNEDVYYDESSPPLLATLNGIYITYFGMYPATVAASGGTSTSPLSAMWAPTYNLRIKYYDA